MRKIKKLAAKEAVRILDADSRVRNTESRLRILRQKRDAAYMAAAATPRFNELQRLFAANRISHIIFVKDGILYYEVCRCEECVEKLHGLGLSELVSEETCVLGAQNACSQDENDDEDEDENEDEDAAEEEDEHKAIDEDAPEASPDDVCISSEPIQHVSQDMRVRMGFELARMQQLGELSENDVKRVMVQPDIGIC